MNVNYSLAAELLGAAVKGADSREEAIAALAGATRMLENLNQVAVVDYPKGLCINIHAMDAKSFNENAHDIADAVALAVRAGHPPGMDFNLKGF